MTDAQKRAVAKYSSEKMATVSCRISKAKAERFKQACETLGKSKYSVLNEAIENTIKTAEEK